MTKPEAHLPERNSSETTMPDPNSDDDAFARAAFARLDPIEPSASLLRRVAAIPIETPREPTHRWWALWGGWPARWAMVGALGLGALVGAIPLEEVTTEASASEDIELEDALALAFGAERSSAEVLLEDFP